MRTLVIVLIGAIYEPGNPEDADIVAAPGSLVGLALLGGTLALMAGLLWWGIWLGAFTVTGSGS